MNIVIISYRSDYTDICMGCSMGTTESDMQYGSFDSIEHAAGFLGARMADSAVCDQYAYAYAEYEFSYIINGIDYEDGCPAEDFDHDILFDIKAAARIEADILIKRYKEAKAKRTSEEAEILVACGLY